MACFPWSLLFLFLDALLYQKITVRKHTFIWLILLFPIWNFSEENPNLTNQMLIRCRVIKSTGEWYNFQLYWWWKIEYLPALYPHFFFFLDVSHEKYDLDVFYCDSHPVLLLSMSLHGKECPFPQVVSCPSILPSLSLLARGQREEQRKPWPSARTAQQ